jgi:hypothetical protein
LQGRRTPCSNAYVFLVCFGHGIFCPTTGSYAAQPVFEMLQLIRTSQQQIRKH